MTLRRPVLVAGDVDGWLGALVEAMRETLAHDVVDCVAAPPQQRATSCASQALCVAEAIRFSSACECALAEGAVALRRLKLALTARLRECTAPSEMLDCNHALGRLKARALVMDVIHRLGILEDLLGDGGRVPATPDCWAWRKQLRYTLSAPPLPATHLTAPPGARGSIEGRSASGGDETQVGAVETRGKVRVSMANASFEYTYEYQGNAPKLVLTPLTDKCYLALTQALAMGYGGSIYGPAGTGKTETVKSLGYALGRQTLVFNCDEGLDAKAMGRVLQGLASSGAWGCFDEFNRLLPSQLSEISSMLQTLHWALIARHPTLPPLLAHAQGPSVGVAPHANDEATHANHNQHRDGDRVSANHACWANDTSRMRFASGIALSPNAAVFVTMNPAGGSYAPYPTFPSPPLPPPLTTALPS